MSYRQTSLNTFPFQQIYQKFHLLISFFDLTVPFLAQPSQLYVTHCPRDVKRTMPPQNSGIVKKINR